MHQMKHSINGAVCRATGRVGFHTNSRRDDLIRRTKVLYHGFGTNSFTHEDVKEAKTAVEDLRIGLNPRCASCAASTPLRAASPACSGFVMVAEVLPQPGSFRGRDPKRHLDL